MPKPKNVYQPIHDNSMYARYMKLGRKKELDQIIRRYLADHHQFCRQLRES